MPKGERLAEARAAIRDDYLTACEDCAAPLTGRRTRRVCAACKRKRWWDANKDAVKARRRAAAEAKQKGAD